MARRRKKNAAIHMMASRRVMAQAVLVSLEEDSFAAKARSKLFIAMYAAVGFSTTRRTASPGTLSDGNPI